MRHQRTCDTGALPTEIMLSTLPNVWRHYYTKFLRLIYINCGYFWNFDFVQSYASMHKFSLCVCFFQSKNCPESRLHVVQCKLSCQCGNITQTEFGPNCSEVICETCKYHGVVVSYLIHILRKILGENPRKSKLSKL